MESRLSRLMTFVRSAITGGVASLADWLVLSIGILTLSRLEILGDNHLMIANVASVPALLTGAVIQFFGNRHFAFRSKPGQSKGALKRQVALFTATELVTLALNHLAFIALVYLLPRTEFWAIAARPISTNIVFVLWSYPVWRWIFTARVRPANFEEGGR